MSKNVSTEHSSPESLPDFALLQGPRGKDCFQSTPAGFSEIVLVEVHMHRQHIAAYSKHCLDKIAPRTHRLSFMTA